MATPEELVKARRRIGPIQRREMRLAFAMLLPTLAAVLLVVLIPVAANFWISVKPVQLADLRTPELKVRERVKGDPAAVGETFQVEYRASGSIPLKPVTGASLRDAVPAGLEISSVDAPCVAEAQAIFCDFGDLEPRERYRIKAVLTVTEPWLDSPVSPKDTDPVLTSEGVNALTSLDFTFENFRKVFDATEFWTVLWVSIVYAVCSTGGALLLGLFAAQLLMTAFPGRAVLRGLFLFPYVSPVIAVAFTWVFLLDPFSGTMNAILEKTGVTDGPINFLGQRGVALRLRLSATPRLPTFIRG